MHRNTLLLMNTARVDKVRIKDKEVEDVEEFVYLGAKVSKGGSRTDITKNRLTIQNLAKLWNTRGIEKKTKIKL